MKIENGILLKVTSEDLQNGHFTIPDGVTSIGYLAFYNCTSLTSVTIPDGVTRIGDMAFNHCVSLMNVTIGNSVTSIGYGAFCNCISLTSVSIPNSVKSIGVCAFYKCFKLEKKGMFKATDGLISCRNHKYEIGKWYEEDEAILCQKGFHYCEDAFDLFNHYNGQIGEEVRFFEIEAEDISQERSIEDSKRVCKKIRFVKEIKSYKELLN